MARAAEQFDAELLASAGQVLGWSEEEVRASRRQAEQRPVDGGIALAPERVKLPYAYLGSWLDCGFAGHAAANSEVGRLLRVLYETCRAANSERLPPTLDTFVSEAESEEGGFVRDS